MTLHQLDSVASPTTIDRYSKALAHPARIAILRFLARQDTCFCGAIVKELPLAQSTVSQHLNELKRAGLIRGTVEGKRTCYCLDKDGLRRAQEAMTNIFDDLLKAQHEFDDDMCC